MVKNEDLIEKAVKRQVGDMHPNGKWAWTEYKPGKLDWRPIKNSKQSNGSSSGGDDRAKKTPSNKTPVATTSVDTSVLSKKISDLTPDEVLNFAKEAKTSQLSAAVNDKKNDAQLRQLIFNELKKREDYDPENVDSEDLPNGHVKKPVATVTYKNGPKTEIKIPESYIIKVNGKPKNVSTSFERKKLKELSGEDLIKKLNNEKGNYIFRQMAFEEVSHRGIEENQLDFSGTLKKFWDKEEERKAIQKQLAGNENEEEAEEYNIDLKGFNMDAFMEKFPGGDLGWMNRRSDAVKKSFPDTLVGRQQYDAVLDYQQRLLPSYLSPANKLGALNQEYENFITKDTTPLFISSGGAGAGKSFGLWAVLDYHNVPELKPGASTSDSDWGWVNESNPDDDADFRRMLSKYNGTYTDDNGVEHGRIVVFDDADKILTTRQQAMDTIMKKILDNNPKARIFVNPDTQENEIWKGRIIVLTNKDIASIADKSEDKKAILSRGKLYDLSFTRNEVIEVLSSRYKTMHLGDYQKSFEIDFPDAEKQQEIRQMAFDFLKEHLNEADPGKFTPRTFIDIISHIGPKIAGGNKSKMLGSVQIGTNIPWQVSAVDILKSDDDEFTEDAMMDKKEELLNRKKELKKENPKLYEVLYGEKALDGFIEGSAAKRYSSENVETENEETEEDAVKGFMDDISDMSVEEAEDLIFN